MPGPLVRKIIIADDDIGNLGGISSAIRTLTEGFRARGISVEYLSLHSPQFEAGLTGNIFEANRFESMTAHHPLAKDYPGILGVRLIAKRALTPFWLAYRKARLREYLGRLASTDAVISMKPRIGVLIESELARRRRSTNDAPFHAHQIHYSFAHWYRPLQEDNLRHVTRGCDALVALWPTEAEQFGNDHEMPAASIPNAITLPEAEHTGPGQSTKIVSCITRLSSDKRVDLAVQAFDLALDQAPGWSLRIYGDGPERQTVENAINTSRHPNAFSLGARLSPEQVQAHLAHADLAILTSIAEGLPMSILEASAWGVPTVATPSSRSVADLTSVHGYLCEGDSLEAIAGALQNAMRNDSERATKSQKCRQLAKQFSVEAVTDKWLELIERKSLPAAAGKD